MFKTSGHAWSVMGKMHSNKLFKGRINRIIQAIMCSIYIWSKMIDHLRQAWISNELKESNVLMVVNLHWLEINLFKPAHVNALMGGLIQFNKVIM